MATLKMKKLRLIGLLEEKDKLVDVLCGLSSVEVVKTPTIEHTKDLQAKEEKRNEILDKLARVQNAINFVDEQTKVRLSIAKSEKDKSIKKPPSIFLGGKREVEINDFYAVGKREQELFEQVVAATEAKSARLKEVEAQIAALSSQVEMLNIYKNVDIEASSIKETENSVVALGRISDLTALDKVTQKFPSVQFTVVGSELNGKKPVAQAIMFAGVPKDAREARSTLLELGFTPAQFDFKVSPKAWFKDLQELLNGYITERREILDATYALNAKMPDTKVLYDLLGLELQKVEMVNKMSVTNTVFMLDGWILAESEKLVESTLHKASKTIDLEFSDAGDNESPPTYQRHNAFVKPFSMVTNMYSIPDSREIDPNPIMAFFYMLLFGIMLADAFYGLVLFLGCFLVLKLKKPTGGGKSLITVVMFGGISAIFWGILLGGYMSFDIGIPALLLSPMDNALAMLLLGVFLGVFHMIAALCIKFVQAIKNKQPLDAIFGAMPWILFLVGAGMLALGMIITELGGNPLPDIFSTIALVAIVAALAIVFLTNGRSKLVDNRGVGKFTGWLFSGLGGLYGTMNYVSDLLSYARIFGLALSGGVVAMVFNKLGGLLMGGPVSAIFGVVIIIFGHTFNLALNVLGVYVHDSRLQYIEFFGKFYTGEGHMFRPLGNETKYNTVIGSIEK